MFVRGETEQLDDIQSYIIKQKRDKKMQKYDMGKFRVEFSEETNSDWAHYISDDT